MGKIDEDMGDVEGGESFTKLRNMVERVRSMTVTPENFEKLKNILNEMSNSVDTSMESGYVDYCEYKSNFQEAINSKEFKESLETSPDFIPRDVYDKLYNTQKSMKSIFQWVWFSKILLEEANSKLFSAIGAVDALRIRESVLKETRESDKNRNDMLKEIVENKLSSYDEKFVNLIKSQSESNKQINNEIINKFDNILDKLNRTNIENLKYFDETIKNKALENCSEIEKLKNTKTSVFNNNNNFDEFKQEQEDKQEEEVNFEKQVKSETEKEEEKKANKKNEYEQQFRSKIAEELAKDKKEKNKHEYEDNIANDIYRKYDPEKYAQIEEEARIEENKGDDI